MLRPPHHLHSSLYKAKTVSFSPHHLSRRFTTNVLYKQQENESKLCPHLSWLLRSPHQDHSSWWKTENLLHIVDFNHLSLADYDRERKHIFTATSKKKKLSYLSSCKYATIPAAIITHPIEKHKTCFIQSTTTILATNCPSWYMKQIFCFLLGWVMMVWRPKQSWEMRK